MIIRHACGKTATVVALETRRRGPKAGAGLITREAEDLARPCALPPLASMPAGRRRTLAVAAASGAVPAHSFADAARRRGREAQTTRRERRNRERAGRKAGGARDLSLNACKIWEIRNSTQIYI